MSAAARSLRPLLRVALPVAVAGVLVGLAIANIALVKNWRAEPEDGVLWRQDGVNVVAAEVAPVSGAARAGLAAGDVLLTIDGEEVRRVEDVIAVLHGASENQTLAYVVARSAADLPLTIELMPMPTGASGLYFSLALVGILGVIVGASVQLRRPNDVATLHFFWLTVAFFGMLAFTPSGRYDTLDYFFDWSDTVARLALPGLFLHFAFVFPERTRAWVRTHPGRTLLPMIYLPAVFLGLTRVMLVSGMAGGDSTSALLAGVETAMLVYLAVCLIGGLAIMVRALARIRSVTARRQLRWIVWGSAAGAVPFVGLYLLPFLFGTVPPFAEYTAVLLGCIPLAFASAIVRYKLMDVEVIIKKAMVGTAYLLLIAVIYGLTLQFVSFVLGAGAEPSRFYALLATFVVVLVAPWIKNAIQAGLDRLHYRDRYDYRRALISFARELNRDLDLDRLASRLVERVRETLGIDRMVLLLARPGGQGGRFDAVAADGAEPADTPPVKPGSVLSARLTAGHSVVVDDPQPAKRLDASEAEGWRDAGLACFVPCVSKDVTIAVLAAGRREHGEPLSSEDMTLLMAVGAQAATALENARLYGELQGQADENAQLRQFNDRVIESLTAAVLVVDRDDRVLHYNRRLEAFAGLEPGRAAGRALTGLFPPAFVGTLVAARQESPGGRDLYRVPLGPHPKDPKRSRLVDVTISPFQDAEGVQDGWIVVIEDVTERAGLEEQLQLSEKMAAIGVLAAGVAHEVNTPLTGISSFTQMLLERSEPSDPKVGLLQKIERQTFRAAKIVSSLLNMSRPSGGETGPVDLNLVIGDVLALLEHQFRTSKVQVRKSLTEPAITVRGVEYKLQQVFLNLFLNARDAMPNGGWLSVSTRADGPDAIIEVADTGVGIPTEHLARIYDPFFTTKPEGGGTGLGLSVTYGIVQEHGGSLTCESAQDQGTRFQLVLPIDESSTAEVAAN